MATPFRDYGDLSKWAALSRKYADLTKKEAQAIFDAYVAAQPRWVEEFLAEVRRRGGPIGQLDFSVESVVPLWTWFLASHRLPDHPASDEEMRAAAPPYWYEFNPLMGCELGPDLARFATLMGAYHGEIVFRAKPGSNWVIGGGGRRQAYYREPLLQVAGLGQMPVTTIVSASAWHTLRGDSDAARKPAEMRRAVEVWIHGVLPPVLQPATGSDYGVDSDYSVEAVSESPGSDRFDFEVTFDDVVAHEQEDRVAAFVERLGHAPGILEAIHEDRELVLVRAPTLSVEALEPIVASVWDEVSGGRADSGSRGPVE